MVEELLELSRIESGQVPLRLNPVLPQAAVCPAVERLRTQAERNHLDLDVQVARDLPLVLVDAGRIVARLFETVVRQTADHGGTGGQPPAATRVVVPSVLTFHGLSREISTCETLSVF